MTNTDADIILTNTLKKGDMVKLVSGWKARIEDNKKGNVRLATVYGYVTEMGSIYAHDIIATQVQGQWRMVGLTPAQKKLRDSVRNFIGPA
jgi:hypothetical protein